VPKYTFLKNAECISHHFFEEYWREFSGLLEAAKATGCRDLTIVTRDEDGEEVRDGLNIRIVPVCRFLLAR